MIRILLRTLAFSLSLSALGAEPAATPPAYIDASAAIEKKGDPKFLPLHESFLKRAQVGPIGVLFLGDSITERWSNAPQIWEKYYGPYQPANFGISGDHTEHVIWRIENGELDAIHPRVVVFMLGTNNTASNTAEEIAAADRKIVQLIREKIPEAKILLLAIFPRGPRKNPNGSLDDGVKRMEIIRAANTELAKLDDGAHVRFLDISSAFMAPDGTIPKTLMPDQLHPNAAGYEVWAKAMQPLLESMLK
jgi:lysophospholipase L1-like esterase